jgi:hypothetical protein
MPSPCGLIGTIASRHVLPSASCYKHIEDTVDCFSIIGTLSPDDRLRRKMRLDEIPLRIAQLSEFHLLPLRALIVRRGLNSFEISSLCYSPPKIVIWHNFRPISIVMFADLAVSNPVLIAILWHGIVVMSKQGRKLGH